MLHIKTKLHLNIQILNTEIETKYANQNNLNIFFVQNLVFYFKPVQTNSWITTFAIKTPNLICLWKAGVCWDIC